MKISWRCLDLIRTCLFLPTLDNVPNISRQMNMCLVVSSEDMPWLDMTHSVVPKMVVMMEVPSRYMMVTMANTRVHREMRSSHGDSNKEGEEESSCLDSHGLDQGLGGSG